MNESSSYIPPLRRIWMPSMTLIGRKWHVGRSGEVGTYVCCGQRFQSIWLQFFSPKCGFWSRRFWQRATTWHPLMSGGEFRQKVKFKIAFLTGGRIDVWILNYNDKGKLKDAIFSLSGDFFSNALQHIEQSLLKPPYLCTNPRKGT